MFRNKIAVTIFAVVLFFSGLFLFYTSNINKTLLVDIYAENPFVINADSQEKGVIVNKNSENNYSVLLPSTFLYQTKTINFQSNDNEHIQLKLYCQQKINNKEMKFSFDVKNIQVNGQNFHDNKETIWYDDPYIDTVLVHKETDSSCTVKYKTKLMLRNTFIPQFAASVVLWLCSLILFVKCYLDIFIKYSAKILQSMIAFLEKRGEWDSYLIQKYRDIDVLYKKTFWIVFVVLNIVFLYYNIHFIWGNHDWYRVLHGLWGTFSWFNGRFTNYLPNQILGGRFLPIITVSFALFGYSFTGILLACYWKVPKTLFNYLVLSLVIVLNPLVVYWMYYFIDFVSHLWLPSIMILALILSERKSFYSFLLACLLIILGLGIYPSGVITIATVWLGKVIIVYCFENHSIKFLFHKFRRSLCCIAVSLCSFKILIVILIMLGKTMQSEYTTSHLFGNNFLDFFKIIISSYKFLIISVPFYDDNIIGMLIGLSIFSFITLCWYQKKYHVIKPFQFCFFVALICLFPLVFSITGFILGHVFAPVRIRFYGYIFLGAFWVVLILKTKLVWAKNVLLVFLIFFLPMNVYRLYDAQKLWKFEFDYQDRIIEKVIDKLHNSPEYSTNQPFSVFIFGYYKPYFLSLYGDKYKDVDVSFFTESFFKPSFFSSAIHFFDNTIKIERCVSFYLYKELEVWSNPIEEVDYFQLLLPYYNVLKNEMLLFPAGNSIVLKDNYLFINFNNQVLREVVNTLEKKSIRN